MAIKFWRFSVLGMGVWGEPGFVVVVVRPSCPQNPSLCQEPSRVAKKNENGRQRRGAACRRAQRPATPAHAQGPTPPTAKYGIAKNGELLGPKVKGRMGYSKANI